MAKDSTILVRRQRVLSILPILQAPYPSARCSLDFATPLQLLIATILSAQCTDERVNRVTPALFARYPDAHALASALPDELEAIIQSTGFYRNKARSLLAMAASLVREHAGQVPRTMEALTALAGVGRKTANVVLGNTFDINVGVVVDTHVARLSARLGLSDHTDPVKIEQDLMQIVPQNQWTMWPHLMIHHGRAICQARKPRCAQCPLLPHCPAGQNLTKAAATTTGKAAKPTTRAKNVDGTKAARATRTVAEAKATAGAKTLARPKPAAGAKPARAARSTTAR